MAFETTRKQFARTALVGVVGLTQLMTGRISHAQTNYGAVVGTVTDTTGANLSGADVVLRNNDTNAALTAKTSGGGAYSFLNLNPGTYSLSVKDPGFNAFSRNQIDVQIGGSTRVDVALPVGDVSQTVTVAASTPVLQTDSAELGGVIEGQQVTQSPLNGRDVNNLLDFIPGVVPGGGTGGSVVSNQGGQTQAIAYGNYQIGGGFSGQSLYFIDGVESNVPENNVNSLVPTQDAVQEFRVSTNNISAEFGGYGGGVVQISTKSGTNKFHGSAYEYFRNTVLDANYWFDNHDGEPRAPLHQNQYGANIGGPILKDKAFFFFSWEHESLTTSTPVIDTVPTAAEVGGDFSASGTNIYNPATSTQYAYNGALNVINPALLDPSAVAIVKAESPTPNQPGVVNNFFGNAPEEGYQNQFNVRGDYTPGKNDQLFARYTYWNPHNGPSDPYGNKTGAGITGNTTHEAVVGETHTINPTTIADIRLAYLQNYNFQTPLASGYNMSVFGPNYATLQQESENQQGLLPSLGIQNYSIGAENSQLYWLNAIYSISGSVTKIVGKHTIKVGGIVRQVLWTNYSNSQGIGFGANPNYTADTANPNAGNALAAFLLGDPTSTGITEVRGTHAFFHSYGFYGTDTYQATNKLTATLGLRWDQPSSYSEENNLDTILQPNAVSPISLGGITNPVTGSAVPLHGNLAFVDSPQYGSRREEALHWKLFQPRVGLTYRLTDKLVVRSGYGISDLPTTLTQDGPQSSSINSAGTGLTNTVGQTPITTPSTPFPNGIIEPPGRSATALSNLVGQGIASRVPNQAVGYVQQWNLAVEQQLGNKTDLTLAYAGAKGTHLTFSTGGTGSGLSLDQLPDQYDSLGSALLNQVANPFYGVIKTGTLSGPTIAEGYLLRPYPQYTGFTQTVPRSAASSYNALQASFKHNFSNNGVVQLAYTYSKLISDTDNTSSFLDGQGSIGVTQDYDNLAAEKSLSQQDYRQNLVVNYGVDLPFGHGERYLGNATGLVNAVAGGWRVNGITTLRSGFPVGIVAAANLLNEDFDGGPPRPNVVSGCNKSIGGSAQNKALNGWFNAACFTQPGIASYGNESRVDSTIKADGVANWDFSATKKFPVTELMNLEFTGELFNVFNRTQFQEPDAGLPDVDFSKALGQANAPREVQFALRYTF